MAGIKNDEWIKHMTRKHKMIEPCKISYADRKGKYQGQKGLLYQK
jgi:deoxycytidine triphosphate deaminase